MKGQIETGKIRIVIDRKYSLQQIREALACSEAGKAKGKVVELFLENCQELTARCPNLLSHLTDLWENVATQLMS